MPLIVKMTWSHPKMPFPQRIWILFSSLSPSKFGDEISSFADPDVYPGYLIPNPNFFYPRSQIPDPKFFPSQIPDLNFFHHGSRIRNKEFKYFKPKKWFLSSQKDDPGLSSRIGSRILILTFYPSQIPILDPRSRSRGQKGTGSQIRIRNTGDFGFAPAVEGSVGYWLSTGAAVLTTHSIDQLSEAFMCKKEFAVYFISTHSL